MLFVTWTYWIFFAIVLALYWPLRKQRHIQNLILLTASYIFYGWWNWKLLGLILVSSFVDYFSALGMARFPAKRRLLLVLSCTVNLGILGLFKYYDFFIQEFNQLMNFLGFKISLDLWNLILPVGISFYTFQSMAYTIDVYRGKVSPTKKIIDFLLYISFFPQLVAGPIERAQRLLPQIQKTRQWISEKVPEGVFLIYWGLFRKIVLADNLGVVVERIFDPAQMDHVSGTLMLFGIYAFSLQIYCDFCAYSDIARGCARLLGFELMINFRAPYSATSPQDFWRRWHISLSQWLRDYLYISLGGNQGTIKLRMRNLIIVMFLGGLWHGASWIFVIWGLYHGLLLCLHQAIRNFLPWLCRLPRIAKQILTFHAVAFGFMIFRSQNIDRVIRHLEKLANPWHWEDFVSTEARWVLFSSLSLSLIYFVSGDKLNHWSWPTWKRCLLYIGIYAGLVLLGNQNEVSFIYFQF